jgi:hypothetical protein
MSKKSHYIHCFLRNAPSTIHASLHHKPKQISHFRGTKNITTESSGAYLKEALLAGRPICAIRFGASEIGCLNNHEKIVLGLKKTYKDSVRWAMKVRAGFYPTDDQHLNEYCDYYAAKIGLADTLAISGLHMEDYFAEKFLPKAHIISNWALEPLLGGWTSALKGKKVLVISAFADEIKFQYSRREKLFPKEPDLLPAFNLSVIQAPQTMGDSTDYRFPSFMRSLEEIENAIARTDFDVALIGAGAYGTLLCLYCRSLGKSALQTGGATQTLFGIIGKRWENRPHVASRINEFWIRPANKPLGYEKIDNGAYW